MWICVSFFCLFPRMKSANEFLVRGILVNTCERALNSVYKDAQSYSCTVDTHLCGEKCDLHDKKGCLEECIKVS